MSDTSSVVLVYPTEGWNTCPECIDNATRKAKLIASDFCYQHPIMHLEFILPGPGINEIDVLS